MKAVRAIGGGVEVVDVDDAPGDGELVQMRSASICGSDFGFVAAATGFVIGHELAGVTADGTPVAVEAVYGCMACAQCTSGRYNVCPRMGDSALGLAVDGGMAEAFRAPASRLVPLPAGLDVANGSLVEPTAVAWHGLRLTGPVEGRRVAVVGGGAIGLLAVAVARAMGAAEVALEARHPHQLAAGERLGAVAIAGAYDIVVEAAGSPSAVARSADLVAPSGAISVLGVHYGPLEVPFLPLFLKEARIVPSIAYAAHDGHRDVEEAAALLAADPGIADALVTHRFGIDEAPEAFRVASDRAAGAIKVVIDLG